MKFNIFRKDDFCIALESHDKDYYEIETLQEQGFIFCTRISAGNSINAVEIFLQREKSKLDQLTKKIQELELELRQLKRENVILQKSGRGNVGNFCPLEILGFSKNPTEEELIKRVKSLKQKFHPDKGGSDFLFKLIDEAFNECKNEISAKRDC